MVKESLIPAERIERRILLIRGQKVMLDFDLAELYRVEARVLNQAVKRNIERFPEDFMFQLSEREYRLVLRSQIVTADTANSSQSVTSSDANSSKSTKAPPLNSSQTVTSASKHRGLAYRPYAFTEQGVAMLSSVLRSPRAVEVNIAIMRAFVKLREMMASHSDLVRKLENLEKKYDARFRIVFEAIRKLMSDDKVPAHREIGYHTGMRGEKPGSGSARRNGK